MYYVRTGEGAYCTFPTSPSVVVALEQRTYTDHVSITGEWEGPEAVEECSNIASTSPHEPTPPPTDESDDEEASEANIDSDSDDATSEDEFVVDESKTPAKNLDQVCSLTGLREPLSYWFTEVSEKAYSPTFS